MEAIIQHLDDSIGQLDNKTLNEKFKMINDKNQIINDNLLNLKKMEEEIINYNPNTDNVTNLDTLMMEIESGIDIIETNTLESSINKYKELMDKINSIENFIKSKAEEYSLQ